MKTNYKMIFANAVAIAAIGISLLACTDKSKPEDTKTVAEEHNDSALMNKSDKKDAEFLVKAAAINLEEIDLGQLAQQNSQSANVKELGSMMEKQHTDAMNQLKSLAEKKAISIPTTITQNGIDAHDKLSKKMGKDFDKEYCNMMVNGHKDAIAMFDKASSESTDEDIRSWATSMLPALRSHLDHAMSCQEKCKM